MTQDEGVITQDAAALIRRAYRCVESLGGQAFMFKNAEDEWECHAVVPDHSKWHVAKHATDPVVCVQEAARLFREGLIEDW